MGKDYYSKYHDEVMGADRGLGERGRKGEENQWKLELHMNENRLLSILSKKHWLTDSLGVLKKNALGWRRLLRLAQPFAEGSIRWHERWQSKSALRPRMESYWVLEPKTKIGLVNGVFSDLLHIFITTCSCTENDIKYNILYSIKARWAKNKLLNK